MKRLVLLLFLLLISACQSDEPVIVKQDVSSDYQPVKEPELLEKENRNDEVVEEFIEFSITNEKIVVNLARVPILKEYIHSKSDNQDVISKMNIIPTKTEFGTVYLLEFSCEDDLCSYLVFNQNDENQAFLIADLAKHKYTSFSPDQKKLLFKFNRNTLFPTGLSNLVVVNVENWGVTSLSNEDTELDILNYNYPILTAEWRDEYTIIVTRPNMADITTDNMLEWQKSGSPTIEHNLHLNE